MIQITREDGLTNEEGQVMDDLLSAWNKYCKLPQQHPDEIQEFMVGLHTLQNLLTIRIARRCYPKGWPIKMVEEDDKKNE